MKPSKEAVLRYLLTLVVALALGLPSLARSGTGRVPAFWQALANCETGGRWDWGRYANPADPRHRAGEGTIYSGGLGFASTSWAYYSPLAGVRVAHAYSASPMQQVTVGRYLLARGGLWGCLHGSSAAYIYSLPGR